MKTFTRQSINSVRLIAIAVFGTIIIAGCDRKSDALLGVPSTSIAGVSIIVPQVDVGDDAVNRAFVGVFDDSGNAISSGLQIGNFSLIEGGVPGVPINVGRVLEPLYLALAIDRSGSMSGARTTAANTAAVALVNALGSSDYAAIVEFESTVRVPVGFTTDKTTLTTAINAGVAEGGTALYDGIAASADLIQSVSGRRLIIVLTDGADTASANDINSAISKVNRYGQSVYTVGLGDGFVESVLSQIATETGGTAYSSATGSDLTSIFLSILVKYENLWYVKYRRRERGDLQVFVNYGGFPATITKKFD